MFFDIIFKLSLNVVLEESAVFDGGVFGLFLNNINVSIQGDTINA